MYGLEVCKALNLPDEFLNEAHNIRIKYNPSEKSVLTYNQSHFNSKKLISNCEICKLKPATEVHHLEYQSKSNENNYIHTEDMDFHKNHAANLCNICDDCHKQIHRDNKILVRKKTSEGYELLAK